MASLFSLLSLGALVCLMAIMGEMQFGWLSWLSRFMAHLTSEGQGGLANAANGIKSGREIPHWTLIPAASNVNIKRVV